jgi:inhibitor of cysteine peptidase
MQKEIKKRAQLYGTVAVISAIFLGALVYNFGVVQREFQLPTYSSPLQNFASYEDLVKFLLTNSHTQGGFQVYGPLDTTFRGAPPTPQTANTLSSESSFKYSTTNIQVAGVDEADIVKTDGEHIFLVSGNDVWISKSYPPQEAQVLGKITFSDDTYPAGIFIRQDKLAVFGSKYTFPSTIPIPYPEERSSFAPYYGDVRTFVNIYDLSDAAKPTLLRNFTISGSYFNSRMIGNYVYLVTSQAAYVVHNDTVILPMIYSNEGPKEIGASEIRYSNVSDNYFSFTTIAALNMQNTAEKPAYETVMMGGTSNMYVSLKNIYITFPESYQGTAIYRIRIENSNINIEANGMVLGSVLNQFSMDEYGDYFRVATTTWVIDPWTFGKQHNNVYVCGWKTGKPCSWRKSALG